MTTAPIDRRALLGALVLPLTVPGLARAAADAPRMVVHKDPTCGCCTAWIAHMRGAGFAVEAVDTDGLNRVKARLGVPRALASCHTAEVGGYVVEGHVPAPAVMRLLAEKPDAKGLAVPGMPLGSPGMEVEGAAPETYDVVLFGPGGQSRFARFKGAKEI